MKDQPKHKMLWLTIGWILASTGNVLSGDFAVDLAPPRSTSDEWRFRIAPYGWATGISGNFSQFGLPLVEVNQSFGDALEHVDAGAMVAFEAWRGRYGLFSDFMYVRLSGSGKVPVPTSPIGSLSVPLSLSGTSMAGMLAGQYRWLDTEKGYLDMMAGARYTSLETRIEIGAPLNLSRSDQKTWIDPMIGIKGFRSLPNDFYLTGWAMVGGGVGNARSIIDLMAGVGYQMTERTALIFAYRYLFVDYQDGRFIYDAAQHGFGIGLDLRF